MWSLQTKLKLSNQNCAIKLFSRLLHDERLVETTSGRESQTTIRNKMRTKDPLHYILNSRTGNREAKIR